MSASLKKLISYALYALGIILTLGGISIASKPSIMPLSTVIGAFVIPVLIFWWATILYRSSKVSGEETSLSNNDFKADFLGIKSEKKKYFYLATGAIVIVMVTGLAVNRISKSELEDCIQSGIKAKKEDFLWKALQESGVGESDAVMEHRVRIQCMQAIHGK